MNQKDLEHFIKEQGWSFFGIVDIQTVQSALKKHHINFKNWLKKGFQADMDYLSRMEEDRFHPENKLPDVKSVIVLGAMYSNGSPNRSPDRCSNGCIARYAVGKDYHKVLKKKLIKLSDYLKNHKSEIINHKSEINTFISVDSGPTVDRVLAESAGLGYFGKNSCIINPKKGSFFFIASLMTNLDLEPTLTPRMPNCGDCTKCLDSCPTGALTAPGVIDARKCISYLTIENKGPIPLELREKIGDRLFGCDACQECCPFNQRKIMNYELRIENFKPESGVGELLDLKEILSIKTDEAFTQKFAGTPLMRAKRIGLLRNACVVAGNSGDKSLIPQLKDLIEREKNSMLLNHAKWALNQLC